MSLWLEKTLHRSYVVKNKSPLDVPMGCRLLVSDASSRVILGVFNDFFCKDQGASLQDLFTYFPMTFYDDLSAFPVVLQKLPWIWFRSIDGPQEEGCVLLIPQIDKEKQTFPVFCCDRYDHVLVCPSPRQINASGVLKKAFWQSVKNMI